MGPTDYFKQIETMTPDEVRKFLQKHRPEDYNIVDVRQPQEYEQAHLPGARLIPVSELTGRLGELDSNKPTIAY
jgi:sulfur-carrier protein adenylyltransferase/sulfurtransferase